MICFDPFGHGVLSNISNNFGSTSLVVLSRFKRSTGLLDLDDRRRSPSADEEGRPPLADKEGWPPFGDENGSEEAPSAEDVGRGRVIVRGDRKEEIGPSSVGGR